MFQKMIIWRMQRCICRIWLAIHGLPKIIFAPRIISGRVSEIIAILKMAKIS